MLPRFDHAFSAPLLQSCIHGLHPRRASRLLALRYAAAVARQYDDLGALLAAARGG